MPENKFNARVKVIPKLPIEIFKIALKLYQHWIPAIFACINGVR
jgi:hypothetical protein